MRSQTLLTLLCFAAVIVGSQMYLKKHLKNASNNSPNGDSKTQKYIASLEDENDQLRRDNAALRQLASSDATIEVDPALIAFVEKDLDLTFRTAPVILKQSEDMLRDAAAQLWLAAFSEVGLEMRSFVFDILGILPPNQNFIGQCIAADTVGAIGVYDYSSGEIALSAGFDNENVHHQASLVRLLAIALLEQEHPLPKELTDDQFYSHVGIIRARASMLQDRFYTLQARHNGFIDSNENAEARETFESFAPYVKEITQFSNTYAKDFLAANKTKPNNFSSLIGNNLTTRDIYRKSIQKTPLFQPDTSDNNQLSTRLGAITLKGFLRRLENSDLLIKDSVTAYQSDSLNITISDDKKAITEWKIAFLNRESAKTFHRAAEQIFSSMESPPTLLLEETQVIFRNEDPLSN